MRNVAISLLVILGLGIVAYLVFLQPKQESQAISDSYNPAIDPANFSTDITNKYFRLPVGRQFFFEEHTAEGFETTKIEISSETRTIMGVKTVLYRDIVHVDGVLVEDTRDYLAQDRDGNVWYFGEEVDNYENGILVDHAGSWIAGIDGAKPGIWIKNDHKVGDSYRQEFYKGKAEDMRDVVAVDQTVTTKLDTYTGCVKMYDWTPLDPQSREHKYYCPKAGALVATENIVTGERTELVKSVEPSR